MEQFDRDTICLQSSQNSIHDLGLVIETDAAIAETVIGWNICITLFTGKIKFMLDRRLSPHTMLSKTSNHTFKEGARASFPWCTICPNHVAHHAASIWDIGQDH